MNYVRAGAAVLGTLFVLAVLTVVTQPELAESVPVETIVQTLGNDYLLIALFGAAALGLTIAVVGGRAISGLKQATPPRPETVQPAPRFGTDFDKTLDNDVGPIAYLFSDRREQVRERLRETAIETVAAAEGCSRQQARTKVQQGEWTTDDEAAAFLHEERTPPASARIRAAIRGNTWFQRGARRTAGVVVEKSNAGGRR